MKRLSRIIAVAFAVASVAGHAQAVELDELRFGVLAHSCCGMGSSKEGGVAFNGEAVFSSPRFLSVLAKPRPVIGATIATQEGATSQFYSGLEWRADISRWFVSAGLGVSIHDGETDRYDPVADAARVNDTIFFGCRALFRLAADAGYNLTDRVSASVHWDHISNDGLCSDNEGLDHLGLRVGFSF